MLESSGKIKYKFIIMMFLIAKENLKTRKFKRKLKLQYIGRKKNDFSVFLYYNFPEDNNK